MKLHRASALLLTVICLLGASATFAEPSVDVVPDVVYGHKMGMALTFDVLKPTQPNGAGILYMVSGGWVSRWAPPERTAARLQKLLDAGFTVFAVRHGSSPLFKVPDAVADVRRATRFIHANAATWGVDPERLGVFGGSAGGHLSLMLGLASDEGDASASDPVLKEGDRVAAVVAYFPPVDLTSIVGPNDRFPALDFAKDEAEAISPIFFVSSDDPPTLLVHGDADTLVPLSNSERIYAAFEKADVETNLIVIKGAGHGFRGKDAEDATEALVAWFQRYLTPSAETPQATAAR